MNDHENINNKFRTDIQSDLKELCILPWTGA